MQFKKLPSTNTYYYSENEYNMKKCSLIKKLRWFTILKGILKKRLIKK